MIEQIKQDIINFSWKLVKNTGLYLVSYIPILLYLDSVAGVQWYRDYGLGGVVGFVVCMIIFGEVYARVKL